MNAAVVAAGRLPVRAKVVLALEILRAYVRVRWLLRTRPFPDALHAVRDVPAGHTAVWAGPVEAAERRRLGRAVQRTLRLLPTDARCLTQALVLLRLLARRGVEATLVLGVAVDSEFAAHAWVEDGGVPLLPAKQDEFARLTEL